MKKLFALTMALVMFATAACACAKNDKKSSSSAEESSAVGKKAEFTKSEVKAYPVYSSDPIVFNCLFRENLPEVPFIDAEDFLNQIFTEKLSFEKGENGVFKFKSSDFTLTFDAEKDTVSCESIESFAMTNHKIISDEEKADYINPLGTSTEDEVKPFSVDLGKYDIDITECDGRVYLPYCTIGDLFADVGCLIRYKNGEFSFKSTFDVLETGGGKVDLEKTRSKEMAQFSYNELCMTMDSMYGLPSMSALSSSIREKGFDETLSSYNSVTPKIRELLLSEDNKEYCQGVCLLNYYLYDGGHTQMDRGLLRSMEKYDVADLVSIADEVLDKDDPELAAIHKAVEKNSNNNALKNNLISEKRDAYSKFECVATDNGTSLYRSGDTYFFDFNSFKIPVVKPFKDALDYAAANHAKNFVIDLSTNGGGSDFVVNYMLAMMLGSDTHFYKSSASDSKFKTNILVDKNLDGNFDEKDNAVSYDFRFAVITSQYSYSNANCMPCAAQDGGIAILGETSGGGSCIISAHYFPNACLYSISGSSYNIHPDGTDVDSGTKPDTALPGADKSYAGFYDLNTINAGIEAFYNK